MRSALPAAVAGACMYWSLWCRQAYAQQPTPTPEVSLDAVVEDLVVANHVLADQSVVDGFGHISAHIPRDLTIS